MQTISVNKISSAFILFILVSCVPKSKYDQTTQLNNILQFKLDSVIAVNDSITTENHLLAKQINDIRQEESKNKLYTEEDAKGYLEDYFKFYATDKIYKNVQIRKTGYNTFHISLREKNRGELWLWYSQVKYLTINSDGTYRIR